MAVRKELPTTEVNQKSYLVKKIMEWIFEERDSTEIAPLDNKLSSTAKFVFDRYQTRKLFFWRGCQVQILVSQIVFQNMKRIGNKVHLFGKPTEVNCPGDDFESRYEFADQDL